MNLSMLEAKRNYLLLKKLNLGIYVGFKNPLYKREKIEFTELRDEVFLMFDRKVSTEAVSSVFSYCHIHHFMPHMIEYVHDAKAATRRTTTVMRMRSM